MCIRDRSWGIRSSRTPSSSRRIRPRRDGAMTTPFSDRVVLHMGRVILGCAGFPVPPTRYFKDFAFVEIQETHIAVPGMGTVRRWKREAPAEFQFAMLGPREIGQEGFRSGKVVEAALKSFAEVGKELDAK